MTATELYIRSLRRRLWMSRLLRDERCEEIAHHIAQRELQLGRPMHDAAEIAALMGADREIAAELNAALPWWRSRPPLRLLASPLLFLAVGYAAIAALQQLMMLIGEQRLVGVLTLPLGGAVPFFAAVLVALYARRLCVRPLHALLPLAVLVMLIYAALGLRPGYYAVPHVVGIILNSLTFAIQVGVLAWSASRGARSNPGTRVPLMLALSMLPMLAVSCVESYMIGIGTLSILAMSMSAAIGVLVPAWIFQRFSSRQAQLA